jgi:hypothetical protein
VFVHGGSPSSFTLARSVNEPPTLSIDQGIGSVAQTGSQVIATPAVTTTYTITATTVLPNGAVTLSWSTQGAATITLNPGNISVTGTTTRVVNPASTTTNGGPYTTINFADGADGDYTSGNVAFPGGGGDNFAMEITETLVVNTPGEYTFMVNSDDGCRLRIDMRCEQNNSWSSGNNGNNALMREEFARLTQRDMGQPLASPRRWFAARSGLSFRPNRRPRRMGQIPRPEQRRHRACAQSQQLEERE